MQDVELLIIGGGPAGLAAAIQAYREGVRDILILERDRELGGILQQCIHNGFGLHLFGEELTGPEYAERFIEQVEQLGIRYQLNTMVVDLSAQRIVTAINSSDGLIHYRAQAVILAMGCRERSRGALNIPGSRPAGIYTAGTAQRYVNIDGYLPGESVVILGSGDIGLIMARRMTLEGAAVKMVCELLPYSGGLTRNIVQCLEDFNIPLKLSHTVVAIHGTERLTGVTIAQVDANRKPIPETFEFVPCDTLLLSVGLIPENELSRAAQIEIDPVTSGPVVNESMETSQPGIFACGNAVHVHDLVDYVTLESQLAGKNAAQRILGSDTAATVAVHVCVPGQGVRYVVPHLIRDIKGERDVKLFFRVTDCFKNVRILVSCGEQIIYQTKKVKVAPGEMESIVLPQRVLEQCTLSSDISVKLEQVS